MGLFDKNEKPSVSFGSRVYGSAMSGNPDVHSSLTKQNPSDGERAIVSGRFGAGVDIEQLAEWAKNGS